MHCEAVIVIVIARFNFSSCNCFCRGRELSINGKCASGQLGALDPNIEVVIAIVSS